MKRIPYGESPGGKTTEPFSDKLKNANQLIEYLESKGFKAAQTRLGEYVKFYEKFLADKCTKKEVQDNLLLIMREMDEWSWIYRGLKVKEPEGFLELLKEALGGPTFSKNESANTRARNIQLELRIGSYFLQSGFDINFAGLSDLVVDVAGHPVFVECKRLNSPKQVTKRAKEAASQLKARYKVSKRPAYGLVVLDVSRVIHPEQGIATGVNTLVARDGIRAQLVQFDREHDTSEIFAKDKKLISVWIQAIVPTAHLEENEPSTRFSSIHSIYAHEGQRRWHLFHKLKKAFEVV
ncbi:hypothetical protein [Sulfuriflexus mobilis]|uniref:hypothetical protein n=1 Tax=Sulfuriflexus mobilis TaxID=1811807 RepID=UPI000F8470C8|nr:hypothetical protein [Sulfuriflexus mobilis]